MKLALLLVLAPATLAQDVWVVAAGGGGDFLAIQPAVDFASQGDTLLIEQGSYLGFQITNKSLRLVADSAIQPVVNGPSAVRDLGFQREVVVAGLNFQARVETSGCNGAVLFEDCRMALAGLVNSLGGGYFAECSWGDSAVLRVEDCLDVTLIECFVQGRDGTDGISKVDGADGESGVRVLDARVSMYASTLRGGDGGDYSCGLNCFYAGDGGHAVEAHGASFLYLTACNLSPGAGGFHYGFNQPACGGEVVYLTGAAQNAFGTHAPALLEMPAAVRQPHGLDLSLTATVGHGAFLITSVEPQYRYLNAFTGLLHTSPPLAILALGAVPGNGVLQQSLSLPPLVGVDFEPLYLQAFLVDAGQRYLSNPRAVVILDPAF